jgi:hypothetical protein
VAEFATLIRESMSVNHATVLSLTASSQYACDVRDPVRLCDRREHGGRR